MEQITDLIEVFNFILLFVLIAGILRWQKNMAG
jgi:hypothetical protein